MLLVLLLLQVLGRMKQLMEEQSSSNPYSHNFLLESSSCFKPLVVNNILAQMDGRVRLSAAFWSRTTCGCHGVVMLMSFCHGAVPGRMNGMLHASL